jgi:hypothetical protein
MAYLILGDVLMLEMPGMQSSARPVRVLGFYD